MTVVRGRYYGFIFGGPSHGQVLESEQSFYRVPIVRNITASFMEENQSDPIHVSDLDVRVYHHLEVVIGRRVYGVWMDETDPAIHTDDIAVALIDMDPDQARFCEVRRI